MRAFFCLKFSPNAELWGGGEFYLHKQSAWVFNYCLMFVATLFLVAAGLVDPAPVDKTTTATDVSESEVVTPFTTICRGGECEDYPDGDDDCIVYMDQEDDITDNGLCEW